MLHPLVIKAFAVGAALLLIASFAPSPKNWFRDDDERIYDVTVTAIAEWDAGVSEGWSLRAPGYTTSESPWINLGALFKNLLAFGGSPERVIRFTIEPEGGGPFVQTRTERTQDGGRFFDHEERHTIVFTDIPAGRYHVGVVIEDEAGRAYADTSITVTVPSVPR